MGATNSSETLRQKDYKPYYPRKLEFFKRNEFWAINSKTRMGFSGMLRSVALVRITRCNIPEDAILHSHRLETSNLT
jgi:hypothetical protein